MERLAGTGGIGGVLSVAYAPKWSRKALEQIRSQRKIYFPMQLWIDKFKQILPSHFTLSVNFSSTFPEEFFF